MRAHYDELLEKAQVRRMRTMAIECFKILSKLSPSCLHDLVVFKDCKYNFRYSNIVDIPRVPTSTSDNYNWTFVAIGSALGVVATILLVIGLIYFRNKNKNSKEQIFVKFDNEKDTTSRDHEIT